MQINKVEIQRKEERQNNKDIVNEEKGIKKINRQIKKVTTEGKVDKYEMKEVIQ